MHEETPGFLKQFEEGKSFTQGTDRQGRPVTYINVALHKASEQPQEVRSILGWVGQVTLILFGITGLRAVHRDEYAYTSASPLRINRKEN